MAITCADAPRVSTHSRPKAAAWLIAGGEGTRLVSTHSRPKAAARDEQIIQRGKQRFNTQPPEGGCEALAIRAPHPKGFNTQPPEGGCLAAIGLRQARGPAFQHTAARRRLL